MLGLLNAFIGADGTQDKETMEMVERMAEKMLLTMVMTCEVEVSLVNYVDLHSDCRTEMKMHMDMKDLMPPEMLAESPEMAADLPTLDYLSSSRDVSDRTLVQ